MVRGGAAAAHWLQAVFHAEAIGCLGNWIGAAGPRCSEDGMNRKLGRLPHDRAVLTRLPTAAPQLAVLQDVPTVVDWSRDVAPGNWGMCGNDVLGDCTSAVVAHAIALWRSYCPPVTFLTDRGVVAFYSAVSG